MVRSVKQEQDFLEQITDHAQHRKMLLLKNISCIIHKSVL